MSSRTIIDYHAPFDRGLRQASFCLHRDDAIFWKIPCNAAVEKNLRKKLPAEKFEELKFSRERAGY